MSNSVLIDAALEAASAAPNSQEGTQAGVTLESVAAAVREHYGDDLTKALKVGLGVIAALSLKARDHCLALIYIGASGYGKSTVCRLFMPESEDVAKVVYRADGFTRASFVSHSANQTKADLDAIDLLPQIRSKTMVTKELSALLSDEDKELRKTFGILTSVLDGNGYESNSGSHGKRSYSGEYVFNWIGASTPLPQRTYELMAQLGNRMLFYRLPVREKSEEQLVKFAENNGAGTPIDHFASMTNQLIAEHFNRYPVNTIETQAIAISRNHATQIVRLARLIGDGRVAVHRHEYESERGPDRIEYAAATPEAPERTILLLKILAMGLALINGRMEVTAEDIWLLRHVALSTIHDHRRELILQLVKSGGTVNSTQLTNTLGRSRPAVHGWMRQLAATRIASLEEHECSTGKPMILSLNREWRWLLDSEE